MQEMRTKSVSATYPHNHRISLQKIQDIVVWWPRMLIYMLTWSLYAFSGTAISRCRSCFVRYKDSRDDSKVPSRTLHMNTENHVKMETFICNKSGYLNLYINCCETSIMRTFL
jgi:hypothetical protein